MIIMNNHFKDVLRDFSKSKYIFAQLLEYKHILFYEFDSTIESQYSYTAQK